MSFAAVIESDSHRVPGVRAWHWLLGGVALLRRSPGRVLLLTLAPLLVEAPLQMLPSAGVLLSKITVGVVSVWTLVMLDTLARTGRLAARDGLQRVWRAPGPVCVLVLLGLAVFAIQLGVAAMLSGLDQAVAVAMGDLKALRVTRAQIAAVLASGVLVSLPLAFVAPQLLLGGQHVRDALRTGLGTAWHARRALAWLALGSTALVAALPFAPWMLLLMPILMCACYAAWRDLLDTRPA